MSDSVNIKDLFLGLQDELLAALGGARRVIEHPGAKGEASELRWQRMLETYLPQRYRVDKAFVVDASGARSEQIDLVIYDRQYSPFLLKEFGALHIPAESVYAVIEVKQEFSRATIEYAGAKAASVRRLQRTSAPIVQAIGTTPPKPLFPILAGIVALESSWAEPFGPSFRASLAGLDEPHFIDLGCSLRQGAFHVSSRDPLEYRLSRADAALVAFFLWLFGRLQSLGTVPAIDTEAYAQCLE